MVERKAIQKWQSFVCCTSVGVIYRIFIIGIAINTRYIEEEEEEDDNDDEKKKNWINSFRIHQSIPNTEITSGKYQLFQMDSQPATKTSHFQ